MKAKKVLSIVLSVIFGAAGIVIVYVFLTTPGRNAVEFVLGASLLFLAVFNLILTLRYSGR